MSKIVTDEEGDIWPPPLALVAFIQNYAGNPSDGFNGMMVELGGYLPEHFMFECILFEEPSLYLIHSKVCELQPANEHTKLYIESLIDSSTPLYADEVYDLRDRLDDVGISVKAESIAEWTADQRHRIDVYVSALEKKAQILPIKPEELP